MNLRSRLLLGYGYLVAILILSAATAALGFHQLGANIGRVLEENFKSVQASMAMLHALERQDSAVLASLLDEAGATRQIAQSEDDFRAALEAARRNVTIDAEETILDAVEERYETFCAARDSLIITMPEHPLNEYETTAQPAFESVKDEVLELLAVNHQAMVDADERARATAQSRAVVHGLLVLVALLSLVVLARSLGRELLDRLIELRAVAQALASGDRTRRATVVREDELGLVAQQLNALLDRELAVEGELVGRLQALRHLVLGLLDTCAGPAALVSPAGELLASNLDDASGALVETAADTIKDALSDTDAVDHRVSTGGRTVNFRRITTTGGRVVGWLVAVDQG